MLFYTYYYILRCGVRFSTQYEYNQNAAQNISHFMSLSLFLR